MVNGYYKTFDNKVNNYYQNALKSYYERHMDYHNSYRNKTEQVPLDTTPKPPDEYYRYNGDEKMHGTNYMDAKYVIVAIIWIIAAYLLLVNLLRRKGSNTYAKTATDDPDAGFHCGGTSGAAGGRCVSGGKANVNYGSFGGKGGGGNGPYEFGGHDKKINGNNNKDKFNGNNNNNNNNKFNGNNNPPITQWSTNINESKPLPQSIMSPPSEIPRDTNSTTYYENLMSIGQTLLKLSPFNVENGKKFDAYEDNNGNKCSWDSASNNKLNSGTHLQSVKIQETKNGFNHGYAQIGDY